MLVTLNRILISPFQEDFLWNVHEPVKFVSLPFFHCNLFLVANFPARYIVYQNYYYRSKSY